MKKKDDFKTPYDLALYAAGGNASKPKCKGKDLGSNDNLTGKIQVDQNKIMFHGIRYDVKINNYCFQTL